jgi:hypothetical protein
MNASSWSSRRHLLLIAFPACCGAMLILVAAVAHSRQPLAADQAKALIAWAVPLALAGCAGAIPLLGACLVWAGRSQTRKVALAVAALLTYLTGFACAGAGSPGFLFMT